MSDWRIPTSMLKGQDVRALEAERDRLAAEVARLEADKADLINALEQRFPEIAKIDRLAAEVERLRADNAELIQVLGMITATDSRGNNFVHPRGRCVIAAHRVIAKHGSGQ